MKTLFIICRRHENYDDYYSGITPDGFTMKITHAQTFDFYDNALQQIATLPSGMYQIEKIFAS